MGADWYVTSVLYGYAFKIPKGSTYHQILHSAFRQHKLEPPFEVVGLLSEFHSRMECDSDDNQDLDEQATVVVGFCPDDDFDKSKVLLAKLNEEILPLFKDYAMYDLPGFHTGIEWRQPLTYVDCDDE